jgi:hypothetical protein
MYQAIVYGSVCLIGKEIDESVAGKGYKRVNLLFPALSIDAYAQAMLLIVPDSL